MSARVRDVPQLDQHYSGRAARSKQVAATVAGRSAREPRLVQSSPTARARQTASSRPLTPSLR